MKSEIVRFEQIELTIHRDFNVEEIPANENIKQDLTSYIYRINENRSKLVLLWELIIKGNEIDLFRYVFESEYIIELDNNKDIEIMTNLIQSSYIHIEGVLSRQLRNHSLMVVLFPQRDFTAHANEALRLASQKI